MTTARARPFLHVIEGGKSSLPRSDVSSARVVVSSQTGRVDGAAVGGVASTPGAAVSEAVCPEAVGPNGTRVLLSHSGTEESSIFDPSDWFRAASFFLADGNPCWGELDLPDTNESERLYFLLSPAIDVSKKTDFFESVLRWSARHKFGSLAEKFLEFTVTLDDQGLRFAAVCALGRVLSPGSRSILLSARNYEQNPLIVSMMDAYIASAAENGEAAA